MFEADLMWKRANPNLSFAIRKEDLNVNFITRMKEIDEEAWEATLKRPWGFSPFTGKANWADGSNCVSEPCTVSHYG